MFNTFHGIPIRQDIVADILFPFLDLDVPTDHLFPTVALFLCHVLLCSNLDLRAVEMVDLDRCCILGQRHKWYSPPVVLAFQHLSEEQEEVLVDQDELWPHVLSHWRPPDCCLCCFVVEGRMTFLLAQRQLVMLRTLMSSWLFLPSVWDQNLGDHCHVCLVVVEAHIAIEGCVTNSSHCRLAVFQGMIFHPWDSGASFWRDLGNHSSRIGSSVAGVLDQHLLLLPMDHQLMLPCLLTGVYR